MQILNVYTDGGSRGNPGPSSIGVVFEDEVGSLIWQKNQAIGNATNNEAEYQALIYAMKHVNRYHPEKIVFHSDSELMIRQMKGEYKIKEPEIQQLFLEAWNRKIDLNNVEFVLIPREQNRKADSLVNKILNQTNLEI